MNMHVQPLALILSLSFVDTHYAISLMACDDPFLARTTNYLILVMSFHTQIPLLVLRDSSHAARTLFPI